MTPEQAAQALITGTLDGKRLPSLRGGPFRDQVVERLAAVGLDLIYSKARDVFFAHPKAALVTDDGDGYRPHHSLREDARWLLSIVWMFLVYLPDLARERGTRSDERREPTLRYDDLSAFVREAGMKVKTLTLLLGQLKKAAFVEGDEVLREGYRMAALPTWEMAALWDRHVQEFRRQEWFREKYKAYLAERGLDAETAARPVTDASGALDAAS